MIAMLPLNIRETHRRELHCHAAVLSHVWTQVSAILSLLNAEQTQGEDVCSYLIEMLHLLHTVAESAATYVEPRPLLISLSCRLAPARVADAVEATIRSLVLLRDTCRSMPWATTRERQHARRQLRDLQTLVQHTITTLETETQHTEPERINQCQ